MKKCICLLLAAVMVLALAACGGNDTPVGDVSSDSQQDPQTQSVDLKQTAADAVAALGDEYPMFPVKDTAELESLYPGLTAVETKQLVAYQPPEVADAADAETVRAIFQQRVDSIANDDAYPENAPAWKNNSAVTVNGNYVVLGVLPEGTDLPAAFKAEF